MFCVIASDAAARSGEPATLTDYDKVQKPIKVTVLNESADRNSYTFYDDRHRPTVTVVDMDGDGAGLTPGSYVNNAAAFTTDPGDLVTRTTYDRSGNPLTVTDADGRTSTTVYDGASRPIQVKAPTVTIYDPVSGLQNNFIPTTSTYYDPAGNVMQTVDPRGTRTATYYDAQNRPIRTVTDLNNDGTFGSVPGPNSPDIVKWTGYDAIGNVIYSIDPNGNRTETLYDRADRATEVHSPQVQDAEHGNVMATAITKTEYDKDGNITKLTDARGIFTQTVYDQLDRARIVVANATAAATAPDRLVTESRYDENGNVIAVVLHNRDTSGTPQNQVTTYEFDAFNRRTKELLPSVGDGQIRQTITAYSRAGDVLTVTDPKLQKVESDYDRAGRVMQQRFKLANGTVEETRDSTYDKAGNLLARTDLNGQTTYAYDALNRVTSETRTTTTTGIADSYSIISSYDKSGNRSKVVYPGSGRSLVSVYDRANRLTAMQDTPAGGGTPRLTTFAYDAAGNRTSSTAANGQVTTTTFDAMNRVVTHQTKANATPGAATVYAVAYGYDLAGQRRRATELVATAGARDITWNYDGLYRLTGEAWTGDVAQTRGYTYDPAGNRLSRTVDYVDPATADTSAAYGYDALNRLVGYEESDVAYDYGYDLNGNRTSVEKSISASGTTEYGYDTSNRLTFASVDTIQVFSAAYDARTRRLSKTEGGDGIDPVTTLYRYDGGTNIQELTPGIPAAGATPAVPVAVKTELIRAGGLGGGIGSVLYSLSGVAGTATPEFFVYNAVGSTVATTNNAGQITQGTLYEAFGETVRQVGGGTNNRLRNTKERDATIGLDNDGMRYYDPAIGRYVQRDPIGYGDGLNIYASVHNNPVNGVDPLGLETSWTGTVLGLFFSEDTMNDFGYQRTDGYHGIDPAVLPVTSRITGGVQMVAGGAGAATLGMAALSPDPEPASHIVAGLGALKSAEFGARGWDALLHGTAAQGVPSLGQGVTALSNAAGVDPVTANQLGSAADDIGNVALIGSMVRWPTGKAGPTNASAAGAAAEGKIAQLGLVSSKLPEDLTPYTRSSTSRVASPKNLGAGTHVYVVDEFGTVRVADNGNHAHVGVLGGAKPARGAGEVTVNAKGEVSELNNLSGTFKFGSNSLKGVRNAFDRQGISIPEGAVKGYDLDK